MTAYRFYSSVINLRMTIYPHRIIELSNSIIYAHLIIGFTIIQITNFLFHVSFGIFSSEKS